MIRTLSSYNYKVPFKSVDFELICQKYILQLFIWNGAISEVPDEPQESFTKYNLLGLGEDGEFDTINIARILADYVDTTLSSPVFDAQMLSANSQWWVKSQVLYYTTPATPESFEPPAYVTTQLFNRGYSYGLEGENVTDVPDNIMATGREFRVSRNGIFLLPIYTPNNTVPSIAVDSYPEREVRVDPTAILANQLSGESVQNLWLKIGAAPTDTNMVILVDGVEVSLIIEDEYKYTPIDIIFRNKFGALQSLTFFKEFKAELNATNKTYESNNGQPIDGAHQFKTINVQGREGFNVQSGWVEESINDTIKQLLLSEEVWQYDRLAEAKYNPLNIKSKNIKYKTQTIDRLIQYDIEFEYSYNAINNI